jgi:hypothetical protein
VIRRKQPVDADRAAHRQHRQLRHVVVQRHACRCSAGRSASEHKLWSGTDSGGLLDTALRFALGAGRGSIVAPAAIPGHVAASYGFPRQPPAMREVASCPPLRPSLGLGIAADLVKHPLAPWTLPLAWQPRTKRIMTQERAQDAVIAASQDVCHRIDGQRGHVAAASAVGTLPPSDPPARALDHRPIKRGAIANVLPNSHSGLR